MYKKFRSGIKDVTEEVYTRSLSNLSLLNDSQPDLQTKQEDDDESKAKQEVIKIVKECWDSVESQCNYHSNTQIKDKVCEKNGWQTVRVFVSSTFTDFYCEREVLVKKVFPELREWCRQRQLYLIDCDLRWGVPKDTPTSETIAMCMEELDRCLEETQGQPFFLNMTGERYGWIPTDDDIPDQMKLKYGWVPNTSITFMEILHGAYRVNSSNALFMFRNPDIVKQVTEDRLSRFQDQDDLSRQHLQELKTRLETSFPLQVYRYNCKVEGMVSQHNKQRVNIVDLEEFGDKVLSFFKGAIEKFFPAREVCDASPKGLSVLEETVLQKHAIEEMSNSCLGRKKEAETLMLFIEGHTDIFKSGDTKQPFSRDSKFWDDALQTGNQILCVCSPPGYGKTTLLAWVTQQLFEKGVPVFYHFSGSTCNSHDMFMLLKRFITFLSQDTSKESLLALDDLSENDLKVKLKDLLLKCHGHQRISNIVVILDSLNQLSTYDRVHHLSWLPPLFPSNMRCIVSTTPHPPTVSRLQEYAHYRFDLQALSQSDARDIVKLFLKQFNKKLDGEQLQLILSSECSKSPLWLYLVCEELRVYGDFTSLTKHVQTVTVSVESILSAILLRLLKEDDTGYMEQALSLLASSFGTITSMDLQRLLGNIEKREPLPAYKWLKIRRNLQAYLRIVHYNEQISFSHSLIHKLLVLLKFMCLHGSILGKFCRNSSRPDFLLLLVNFRMIWQSCCPSAVKEPFKTFVQNHPKSRSHLKVITSTVIKNEDKRTTCYQQLADYLEYWCEDSNMKINYLPTYLELAHLRQRLVRFLKESPESRFIPSWKRSQFILHCRCRNLADPVIGKVSPVLICVFCQNRHANLSVNICILNKNMCVACGNEVHPGPFCVDAHLCQFHTPAGGFGPKKCYLCQNIIVQNPVPGRLCSHCGIGNYGKQCAALVY